MPLTQFDERTPFTNNGQILLADGTAYKSIVSASPVDIRLDRLMLSNSDSVPHTVEVAWDDTFGDVAQLGAVAVPAGAGFTQASVEFFSAVMPGQQQFFIVPKEATLKFKTTVAMVGASQLNALAIGGTF